MAPRPSRKPSWKSEADLLEAFAAEATESGWLCFPECCNHDLILVAQEFPGNSHIQSGDVVAVEGKLRGNMALLRQIIPPWRRPPSNQKPRPRADWYLAVVGGASADFREVARALGVLVYTPEHPEAPHPFRRTGKAPELEVVWKPAYRAPEGEKVAPALQVRMAAGLPSPKKVTPWKVEAVRHCLRLLKGPGELQASMARVFVRNGWANRVGTRGRRGIYALLSVRDRPDLAYPEIVQALTSGAIDPVPTDPGEPFTPWG